MPFQPYFDIDELSEEVQDASQPFSTKRFSALFDLPHVVREDSDVHSEAKAEPNEVPQNSNFCYAQTHARTRSQVQAHARDLEEKKGGRH